MTSMTYRTWIIDRSTLCREGLKLLLQHSEFDVVFEAASLDHALAEHGFAGRGPDAPALILAVIHPDFGPETGDQSALRDLCTRFPGSAVVAMADEMTFAQMKAAMQAGARACLLRDITPEVFEHAVLLALSGEKVLPRELVTGLISARAARAGARARDPDADLSSQETRVLLELARGLSNKEIANLLDVTEGTVKTHVKTVLKKLGAQNRTEAAVWAYRNGLDAGGGDNPPQRDAVSYLNTSS
jgi:two-component system nitrate/nitrite response regulator NarL